MFRRVITLCFIFTFAFALLSVGPAFADSDSIAGSWEVLSVSDETGEESPALFTYEEEGTFVGSGPTDNLSLGHGAWEEVDDETFTCTFLSFVYGEDGSIALRVTNTHVVEVSEDGDSFTAEFNAEVALPDGTVINNLMSTGTGTRISP